MNDPAQQTEISNYDNRRELVEHGMETTRNIKMIMAILCGVWIEWAMARTPDLAL
jgi:hypothetical protein